MSALSRRRLRIWADPLGVARGEAPRDYDAGVAPILVKGNALDLEIAIAEALALADLSGIDSLVATFKVSQISEATELATVEVLAADFQDDTDFAVADFTDGDVGAYHARFRFTDAQMTWDFAGYESMTAWLVITAFLADGTERAITFGPVTMVNDNDDLSGGIIPAAIFTVTNDQLTVVCPDGVTRRVLLSDL